MQNVHGIIIGIDYERQYTVLTGYKETEQLNKIKDKDIIEYCIAVQRNKLVEL